MVKISFKKFNSLFEEWTENSFLARIEGRRVISEIGKLQDHYK